ncbi:hypothetical protein IP81_15895 [Novosphingobium sp. AAP83]|uniref:hypothetical protein n=1 Tax=Novosphingobium sp. AAP83 TaxID=1523425 RepID=UPI0006B9DA97|nr:hypothetical protein [Novosphingobium sp. AAP83]KPF90052.1 hypothetical protein IP81_15895 [Novosphingobium sp. AAP83]
MKAERTRLARLKRLERIRDIARRNALAEAGKAESTLAQLQGLVDRTARLSAEYAARTDMPDAHALQQLRQFVAGLDRITTGTRADAANAKVIADTKAQEAAAAERKRAAVEERAEAQARLIAQKIANAQTPLGKRKATGTGLE